MGIFEIRSDRLLFGQYPASKLVIGVDQHLAGCRIDDMNEEFVPRWELLTKGEVMRDRRQLASFGPSRNYPRSHVNETPSGPASPALEGEVSSG